MCITTSTDIPAWDRPCTKCRSSVPLNPADRVILPVDAKLCSHFQVEQAMNTPIESSPTWLADCIGDRSMKAICSQLWISIGKGARKEVLRRGSNPHSV